ncbi:hypothetical protein C1645_794415, partial [Glomus cerebriforme]
MEGVILRKLISCMLSNLITIHIKVRHERFLNNRKNPLFYYRIFTLKNRKKNRKNKILCFFL